MVSALDSSSVIMRRPHFELRGADLYFLISSRPHATLSKREQELWSSIDDTKTVAQLEGEVAGARAMLPGLVERELCEVIERPFADGRPRALVIEPHMDDAVLSIGGTMWKNRFTKEHIILTVTGISNFTSYYRMNREFFDTQRISSIRSAESRIVSAMLGGSHASLGMLDAPLRYNSDAWNLDWYLKNKRSIAAFQNMSPIQREIESWSAAISSEIERLRPDEIWIPLGIGSSVDHQTTRNACLRSGAIQSAVTSGKKVYFYEDTPYLFYHKDHAKQILAVLHKERAITEAIVEDITDLFQEKLRLISVFGSQFKLSYMRERVANTARYVGGDASGLCERFYSVERMPALDREHEMYSGFESVSDLTRRLGPWFLKHRGAKTIRILCPMGTGRWAHYMSSMLERFPSTTFDVYKSSDSLDETRSLVSDRVRIKEVGASGADWGKRLLSLRASLSKPTIICTHSKLARFAGFARLFFAGSGAITCDSLDHLVLALSHLDCYGEQGSSTGDEYD